MKDKLKRLFGITLFVGIIIAVAIVINNKNKQNDSLYKKINYDEMMDTVSSNEECYIWVYSTSCASCRKLHNDVNELKKKKDIFTGKNIFGINIDEYDGDSKDILDQFGTEGVPFIAYYVNGKIEDLLYEDIKEEEIEVFFQRDEEISKLEVEYFFSPTCSNCAKVSKILREISCDYRDIVINRYNVTSIENKSRLDEYCRVYGVNKDIAGMVPIVFVRNEYLYDVKDISNGIRNILDDETLGKTIKITQVSKNFSNEQNMVKNMDLIKFVATALLNGLNPCSFSMLLFLIVLIETERDKVLKLGLLFCAGKVIAFVLLGTVLYRIIGLLQTSIMVTAINVMLIVLLLILAVLNINDYFAIKSNNFEYIKAQLPETIRKKNNNIIKGVVDKFKDSIWIYVVCVKV